MNVWQILVVRLPRDNDSLEWSTQAARALVDLFRPYLQPPQVHGFRPNRMHRWCHDLAPPRHLRRCRSEKVSLNQRNKDSSERSTRAARRPVKGFAVRPTVIVVAGVGTLVDNHHLALLRLLRCDVSSDVLLEFNQASDRRVALTVDVLRREWYVSVKR